MPVLIDLSPEQKKMARELWPEFYSQRVALLDKDIEMVRRIAALNITGIQSREDLMLQYALESGYIDVDRYDSLMHPEKNGVQTADKERKARYQRGLMNPNRLPRGGHRERNLNSARATNRTNAAPSAAFGIGTAGFNVQGTGTFASEQQTHFRDLLNNVK